MQKKTAFNSAAAQVLLLSALTLAVKAAGFLKQALIAAYFGAGDATDLFFIASEFFADVSAMFFSPLAIVFLTAYDDSTVLEGRGKADAFAVQALLFFGLISATAAAVFAVFSYPIARLLGLGLSQSLTLRLSRLLRQLSPLIFFFCAAAILTALLQAQKRFLPSQMRGLVRSAAIIAALLLLYGRLGAGALTLGMLLALPLETAYLCHAARKSFSGLRFCEIRQNAAKQKRLMSAAFPLMLGHAAAELSHIVDKSIASCLWGGAVSALGYAQVLQGFLAALLVSNVGAVTFSHFSKKSAQSDNEGLLQSLCRAAELLILLLLPISIIAVAASPYIVRLAYAHASFDSFSLAAVAQAFSGYAAGLIGLSLQTVFLRGLYAVKNTRLPLKIGLCCIALNTALSLALSQPLGVGGIAIASAASYFLGAAMSSVVLKGRKVLKDAKAVAVAGSVCALSVALIKLLDIKSPLFACALMTAVGTGSYFFVLLLFKEPNAAALVRFILQKRGA